MNAINFTAEIAEDAETLLPATPRSSASSAVKNFGRGADKATRLKLSIYPERICGQCGHPFKPVKQEQSFCCPEHRKQYHGLRQRYGARIMDLAILWRRNRRKGSFTEFVAQVDAILRDHKHELGHAVRTGADGKGRTRNAPKVRP